MKTDSRINIKIVIPNIKKTVISSLKLLVQYFFRQKYKKIPFNLAGYYEELHIEEEILEKMKELAGVHYLETEENEKLLVLRPQKLSTREIEKIFYWTEFYGRWDLTIRIFGFMKRCFPERGKFLEKGTIEGKGVFRGFISPRFWLKWEALYHIIDKKKAIEVKFSDELLFIRGGIDLLIQSSFSNYIFEIGETGSSSLIYEPPLGLSTSQGITFCPKYSAIFEILNEIRNEVIAPYFKNQYGVEFRTLIPVEFGPIDEPSLGLWESDTKEKNKLKEEIFKTILLKIKESQMPTKENSAELLNDEFSIKPQKSQQLLKLVKLEKPRINFCNSEIPKIIPLEIEEKVITKKREASPQIFSLLKCHLEHHYQQNDDIHWLHGFIIFPAWRKKEEKEKMDYLEAFSRSHSFLKRLGKNTKLWTIKERKAGQGDRYKKGHWTLENVDFNSNIFDAWERYKKAKELEKNGKFSEAKQMLVEACNIYPDFLDGHLLLLEFYKKEEFKNAEDESIKQMLIFFEKKKNEYSIALNVIKNLRQTREDDYWKKLDDGAKETIWGIEAAYKKFESIEIDLSKRCEDRKVFTPEEKEWERLKDLIIDVVDKKDEDKFKELIAHSAIKKVIKIVKYKISVDFHDFEEENIERRIVSHFYDEIKKVEIANFSALKYFNSYLRRALYYSVKKEILEEKGVENVEEIMKEIIGKKGKGLQDKDFRNDYPEDQPQC
ncbi:MAG: hypothetical protein WC522_06265 [Candidatus Omnitrophota bacterium]